MAEANTPKDEFSFLSALKPEAIELPKRSSTGGGRSRTVVDNPFREWLSASFDEGTGRAVTVPAENAVKTEYLIRQAGEDLSLGVRVVFMVDGEQIEKKAIKDLHRRKNVRIMFQGQKKRAYSPRRRKGDAVTVETPETVTE